MKALALCLVLLSSAAVSQAQKFISEKSKVTFFSKATIEDIAAHNEKSMGLFDPTTGDAAFSIPIVEFQFEKSLMKEHFNEKYMETEKYPKGTFQGKITGYTIGGAGAQTARAKGQLTIHGVTKEIDVPGTVEWKGDRIMLTAKFMVTLEDYKIKIPTLLFKNIAESVEVSVDFTLIPYEKK
jgi:hypothetical protein